MSDETIARAARRYIAARSWVSHVHTDIVAWQRANGPIIDDDLRDEATRASHDATDAFLDLLLAVRDER